jgi:hypothetical protein
MPLWINNSKNMSINHISRYQSLPKKNIAKKTPSGKPDGVEIFFKSRA